MIFVGCSGVTPAPLKEELLAALRPLLATLQPHIALGFWRADVRPEDACSVQPRGWAAVHEAEDRV